MTRTGRFWRDAGPIAPSRRQRPDTPINAAEARNERHGGVAVQRRQMGPEAAVFQTRARYVPKAIDFGAIDCPVERLAAKEYIYAWMNERLPDRLRRLPPLSVPSELNRFYFGS